MQLSESSTVNKLTKLKSPLYVVFALLCLTPLITAPFALALGLIFALIWGTPFPVFNKLASKYLLQASVVGLGFGMNLSEALKAGADGLLLTLISVAGVLLLGITLGKKMRIGRISAYLISSGTAICGGSAIAAIGPVAKAKPGEMSVSLATVFVLNAVALFLFPPLGRLLDLSQYQFGLWSAIAIHDTSSVVGAASLYGEQALKVATTVKLTRALWIIPLSIFTSFYFKSKDEKIMVPWFIFLFILAMAINSYVSFPPAMTHTIVATAQQLMVLTLFFIGAGLSRSTLKAVGVRPLIFGVVLWFFVGLISLGYVMLK